MLLLGLAEVRWPRLAAAALDPNLLEGVFGQRDPAAGDVSPRPRLSLISTNQAVLAAGTVPLRLEGLRSNSYTLERSPDLVDWRAVTTFKVPDSGFHDVIDVAATPSATFFYRLKLAETRGLPSLDGFLRADRVLVKPKPGAQLGAVHALLGAAPILSFPDLGGLQVVKLRGGASVQQALIALRQSGLVEFAEPDYLIQLARTPNDPGFTDGSLWGLHNTGQQQGIADADIDAPDGWDLQHLAPGVITAVIDSGIRHTHEDLAANIWTNPGESGTILIGLDRSVNRVDDDGNGYVDDAHGINAIHATGHSFDDNGHGSHVSGIIGAVGDNRVGTAGVAWRTRLMACKFLNSQGEGSVSGAIECIEYARRHGAKIITACWGSPSFRSAALYEAIARARQAGILVIAAAGNGGQDNDLNPLFPASYELDNIVVVAATDRTDRLASFSNFGAKSVDLGAPGDFILSTWGVSDHEYRSLSGSSMAAAHVAGACALLWARYPSENYLQIKQRVLSSTDPLPALAGKCVTGGRLNLHRALAGETARPQLVADFSATPTSGAPPLTVRFTDQSQGGVARREWDFGDGSARVTEPNPAHTFGAAGAFTVKLKVFDAEGRPSEKSQVISVLVNPAPYQARAASYSWIDPARMPSLALGDDGVSAPQPLPFDFVFFGAPYSQLYVSANGLIGFAEPGLNSGSNADLPSAAQPNAIAAAYWADLDPGQGGKIHLGTHGTGPHRKVVISWVDVPVKGGLLTSSRFTFQVVLEEGSNDLVFQYLEVEPNRLLGERQTGTVGIENSDGTRGVKFTQAEEPVTLRNRQAVRFAQHSPSANAGPCEDDAGSLHYPDVQTQPPSELAVVFENNRKLLRFSTTVGNLGQGPLDIFPTRHAQGRTEASQRLYTHDADCAWSVAHTRPVGTFEFHAEHAHWHFEDFAEYRLHKVNPDGSMGGSVATASDKISFCLFDSIQLNPHLKHASPQTYSECDQNHPQGISVGWADVYQWYLPGQSLDVTDLPNGDYWLFNQADPSDLLQEGGSSLEANNAAVIKIRLEGNRVRQIE